jgi:hypothetical protein
LARFVDLRPTKIHVSVPHLDCSAISMPLKFEYCLWLRIYGIDNVRLGTLVKEILGHYVVVVAIIACLLLLLRSLKGGNFSDVEIKSHI